MNALWITRQSRAAIAVTLFRLIASEQSDYQQGRRGQSNAARPCLVHNGIFDN